MKYFKTFEGFKKEYMKKIDLKDFKKIKKGKRLTYMGGPAEVIDNNGYVLTLKGKDGKTFTVNKSQFDHGGFINEAKTYQEKFKEEEAEFKRIIAAPDKRVYDLVDYAQFTTGGMTQKQWEMFMYGRYKKDLQSTDTKIKEKMYKVLNKWLGESVNEASSLPRADKALKDLEKQGSQIDWLDDADNDTKKIWKKAGVNPEDENTIILYSYANDSWPETKKILKKHSVDFKELEDPNSAGESFIVFVNELRSTPLSGTMAGSTQSLEDRKYELKKDVKGAQIGNFTNVLLPKGTIIYNLPGGVFADHFSLKNKYASRSSQGPQYFDKPTFKGISVRQMPDILAAIEKNSKVLESFDTEVTEAVYIPSNIEEFAKRRGVLPLVKKIGRWAEKAGKRINGGTAIGKGYGTLILDLRHQGGEIRINLDNDEVTLHGTIINDPKSFKKALKESESINEGDMDSVKKDIMDHWFELYGEKFINEYPAVAKILKQRKNVDRREFARIWDETYGEDFKEKYPAMWDKLD